MIAIVIFILLKFYYTIADNEDLILLLAPTSKIISLVTNTSSEFLLDSGYFFEKLNIVIDKSCSGFNFLILCFIMLTFSGIKFFKSRNKKILLMLILLFTSYFLTIFVNTSRIMFSVFSRNYGANFIDNQIDWLHQAEGTFIYLSFLIIIYLAFNLVIKKITHSNEKLT